MNNRIFKFRIWDKQYKRWARSSTFKLNHEGQLTWNRILNLPNGQEDFVIQQFTGLKDENDKEIYEGDILKREYLSSYPVYDSNGEFIEWSDEKLFTYFYKVIFYCGDYEINGQEYTVSLNGWCVENINNVHEEDRSKGKINPLGTTLIKTNYGWFGTDSIEFEVVGNIFENPELTE